MKKTLQIAIDGPVGAGKTDISSRLAKRLGIVYLYTGAMYRAVAYLAYTAGVPFDDADRVIRLARDHVIDLAPSSEASQRSFTVLVDGQDVTESLFNPVIDKGASDVSVIPEVRRLMVRRQQEMANGKSVVMEGRDIGYRVLPDAQLKIYLTASPEERARRRLALQEKKGIEKSLKQVLAETKERDEQDTGRTTDPLKKLPDAWELDTTGLSQDQVVDRIMDKLESMGIL